VSWAVHEIDEEVHVAPVLDSTRSQAGSRLLLRPNAANPYRTGHDRSGSTTPSDGREFAERAVEAAKGAKN